MLSETPKWNSYSDYYRQELFPYAIEYGMTAKEFWEDDPSLFWSYRISYMQRKKNEQSIQNSMMWLQGAYFYDAISKALANAFSKGKSYKYIDKPFDFDRNETDKEIAEEKSVRNTSFWASFKHRLSNERE